MTSPASPARPVPPSAASAGGEIAARLIDAFHDAFRALQGELVCLEALPPDAARGGPVSSVLAALLEHYCVSLHSIQASMGPAGTMIQTGYPRDDLEPSVWPRDPEGLLADLADVRARLHLLLSRLSDAELSVVEEVTPGNGMARFELIDHDFIQWTRIQTERIAEIRRRQQERVARRPLKEVFRVMLVGEPGGAPTG